MSPFVSLLRLAPPLLAVYLIVVVFATFGARMLYPFDLEWMEGGMLTHAWRLAHGQQLYVVPSTDFIPFIYPPGYPAILAWLSNWFALDYPLGRAVSIAGTLLSALAVLLTVRLASNHASGWRYGLIAAGIWLGTYGATGAFMDIVRPDALGVGLLGCSVVFSFVRKPWAPFFAGLFLFFAFTVKHNLAAFGLPLLIGLSWRGGLPLAWRFVLSSVVPALGFVAWMQVRSEGRFLAYLLGVPSSHPVVGMRVWPGTPWELAEALPVVLAVTSMMLIFAVGSRLRDGRHTTWWLGVVLLLGIVTLTSFESTDPMTWLKTPDLVQDTVWTHVVYGLFSLGLAPVRSVGHFGLWISALGVGSVVLLLGAVTGMIRIAWNDREALSWQTVMLVGLCVVGLGLVALMRGHHGGFINVFMPMMLVLSIGFGVALAHLERAGFGMFGSVFGLFQLWLLTWQLSVVHTYPERTPTLLEELVPTQQDVQAGERVVDRIARLPGPVLSPIAPWMPVQAGHQPGLHLISLWDINHKNGPFYQDVAVIRRDLSSGRISAVIDGKKSIRFGVRNAYRQAELFNLKANELRPKSGWRARPFAILTPKNSFHDDSAVERDTLNTTKSIQDVLHPRINPKEQ